MEWKRKSRLCNARRHGTGNVHNDLGSALACWNLLSHSWLLHNSSSSCSLVLTVARCKCHFDQLQPKQSVCSTVLFFLIWVFLKIRVLKLVKIGWQLLSLLLSHFLKMEHFNSVWKSFIVSNVSLVMCWLFYLYEPLVECLDYANLELFSLQKLPKSNKNDVYVTIQTKLIWNAYKRFTMKLWNIFPSWEARLQLH